MELVADAQKLEAVSISLPRPSFPRKIACAMTSLYYTTDSSNSARTTRSGES